MRAVISMTLVLLATLARSAHAVQSADTIPRHDAFTIESSDLGERRTINVYTPPAYAMSRRSLPVLYMLDGGLQEDFPHVVGTVDSLIRLGRIRPVLVVGIENTERRRDLTGPTVVGTDSAIAPHVGRSAEFRRFIREELVPEVRRRYRCTGETAVVGESLAGLFVVETLLRDPTLFRGYIALSPSLWWNADELVRIAEGRVDSLADAKRRLYLAAANEPGIADQTARLAAILKAHAPPRLIWEYHPRPDLEHGTIFRALAPGAFVRILR